MLGILSVSGIFNSNFDNADILADRVHCGLWKVLHDVKAEKLKANLEHQKTLYDENASLKAKLEATAAAAEATNVGEKRPRTEDEFLDKMKQLLNDTAMQDLRKANAALESQLQDLRDQLQELRDDKEKLHEHSKNFEKLADGTIKRLVADNEKKIQKNHKLCATAKKSAATMGAGTRVFAKFIEANLEDPAALPIAVALQSRLKKCLKTVHANEYLSFLKNVKGMRAFDQTSLGAWLGHNESEDDEP